jgi:carbamate kinase
VACRALAPLAREHQLVVSHGNGPQVGLLALQGAAYTPVETYPMDMLGAQTDGMIGYLIQQELGNELPYETRLATMLTMIEVDRKDPAFDDPTKFIGPVYSEEDAKKLGAEKDWVFKQDGEDYRRVVPSPMPRRIFGVDTIESLLEYDCVVICAGGGGIPTMYTDETVPAGKRLVGVEAVIDKDLASALLAADLNADALLIVTDVDAVYADWGTPSQRAIKRATPTALAASEFADGSMGPKVRAACTFVQQTGGLAAIGSIKDAEALLRREAGTIVTLDARGLELVHST